jgi:hypothetical protein
VSVPSPTGSCDWFDAIATGAELAMVAWPLALTLFGEIETTSAGSVATGAVEAALIAAALVPSLIFCSHGVVLAVLPGCTVHVPDWMALICPVLSDAMVTR